MVILLSVLTTITPHSFLVPTIISKLPIHCPSSLFTLIWWPITIYFPILLHSTHCSSIPCSILSPVLTITAYSCPFSPTRTISNSLVPTPHLSFYVSPIQTTYLLSPHTVKILSSPIPHHCAFSCPLPSIISYSSFFWPLSSLWYYCLLFSLFYSGCNHFSTHPQCTLPC